MSEQAANRGLILVVEDERSIAELQRLYLIREGFGVHIESTGQGALAAVRTMRPVVIVLDIGLDDMDGTEVCRALRAAEDLTPIVFVTARDDEVDRVVGLEIGGDDYLTKPFSPRELVARIRAVLRRVQAPPPATMTVGSVRLDSSARRVRVDDADVELTPTEFDLLAYLMRRPGQVYSRDQLLSAVWGYPGFGSRTVDVHVAQLRGKLGSASPIRTVRGVGYSVETS
ncbi:MAG: response regulator transcription factor [Mycobacteriales bacterium]|nr:MAG: DNA-binding response regulator [Pseudonocardiales bacterium]